MDADEREVLARIGDDVRYVAELLERLLTAATAATAPPADRLAYSFPEAAALLGLSLEGVRELVARGELVALSVGTRRAAIPRWSLVEWTERGR